MGFIRAAAILATDNRFRTPSLELKCLATSFSVQKQKFSIPQDLHSRRVIKGLLGDRIMREISKAVDLLSVYNLICSGCVIDAWLYSCTIYV